MMTSLLPTFVRRWLPSDPSRAANSARRGLQLNIKSSLSAFRTPDIQQKYRSFLFLIFSILIPMYGIAALGLFMIFPLVILFPGIAYQLFTAIPIWSIKIATKFDPIQPYKLFLTRLQTLSPEMASKMEDRKENPLTPTSAHPFLRDLWSDVRRSWLFTKYSLFLTILSAIPLIGGPISWIGQTILISEQLGAQLFQAPLQDCLHLDLNHQKEWLRQRRWVLLGLTLPYTFLLAVPLIGIFALPFAQCATADFFVYLLDRKEEEEENREPNTSRGASKKIQEQSIEKSLEPSVQLRQQRTSGDSSAL